MKIIIDKDQMKQMKNHALESYPLECCGFIFGEDHIDGRKVLEVQPARNSKQGDQRRRFEIDPWDYLKAERYALANELTLVGIYHSHPDHPAKPSEYDLRQAVPFFSYLILSIEKDGVKKITSWQLDQDQQFEEENIEVKNKI